ncbi:MAG: hypothetical protein MnENMB40S_02730 [Rhizobiaceae bacterium MnEN-MB40S]|nr:MAG: hypothetical protein MnENMB40S_02730 [Rhizobiaceae bacterium MnEN-MB40S]
MNSSKATPCAKAAPRKKYFKLVLYTDSVPDWQSFLECADAVLEVMGTVVEIVEVDDYRKGDPRVWKRKTAASRTVDLRKIGNRNRPDGGFDTRKTWIHYAYVAAMSPNAIVDEEGKKKFIPVIGFALTYAPFLGERKCFEIAVDCWLPDLPFDDYRDATVALMSVISRHFKNVSGYSNIYEDNNTANQYKGGWPVTLECKWFKRLHAPAGEMLRGRFRSVYQCNILNENQLKYLRKILGFEGHNVPIGSFVEIHESCVVWLVEEKDREKAFEALAEWNMTLHRFFESETDLV